MQTLRMHAEVCPTWAKPGRYRPKAIGSWPTLAASGPTLAEFGPAQVGQHLPQLARVGPELTEVVATSATCLPNLAGLRPSWARDRPNLCPVRPMADRTSFGQLSPGVTPVGPTSAGVGPNPAKLGRMSVIVGPRPGQQHDRSLDTLMSVSSPLGIVRFFSPLLPSHPCLTSMVVPPHVSHSYAVGLCLRLSACMHPSSGVTHV